MKQVKVVRQARGAKSTPKSEERKNLRRFGELASANLLYRRMMTIAETSITTSAGGLIPAAGVTSSASVTSCADWTSCASMYSSYRVRRILVRAFPFFVVNTTAVTVPALAWVVPFYGGLFPTSAAGFTDSSGVKCVSGYKEWVFTADTLKKDNDLDSHLWTPTNATIPATEQFGIAIMGNAVASTASTVVWRYTAFFEVEFKMMG